MCKRREKRVKQNEKNPYLPKSRRSGKQHQKKKGGCRKSLIPHFIPLLFSKTLRVNSRLPPTNVGFPCVFLENCVEERKNVELRSKLWDSRTSF